MKKLKLYLDTSILNFAIADDIPIEDKNVTIKLFEEINNSKFDAFISEVVLREIGNTKNPNRKENLIKSIENLKLENTLIVNNEVEILSQKYIREKIIPHAYFDDALHIALSSVHGIDVLVSWNFKHLVKHKTRVEVEGVNILMGYKNIDICTPWEVIENV